MERVVNCEWIGWLLIGAFVVFAIIEIIKTDRAEKDESNV